MEVQAVLTSIPVEHGKAPDNAKVTREMVEGTRWLIPTFKATRIAWIHGGESSRGRERLGRRSMHIYSLLVYVPTVELQKKAVRQGIIIALFTLQGCTTMGCKRRGALGATDGGTPSPRATRMRRGHCAGRHDTRKCEQKNNPSMARCCNCGNGGHRPWQTSKCSDYKRRLVQLEE
jgi:hypothetical protein